MSDDTGMMRGFDEHERTHLTAPRSENDEPTKPRPFNEVRAALAVALAEYREVCTQHEQVHAAMKIADGRLYEASGKVANLRNELWCAIKAEEGVESEWI